LMRGPRADWATITCQRKLRLGYYRESHCPWAWNPC